MKKRANATYENKSWDETPCDEMADAPKLTRVRVTKAFQGDFEGESTLEYLMMYRQDGSADFVGLERLIGSLCGRSGSFVLQHKGTFQDGAASTSWLVVPGSGTGELSGLVGEGGMSSGHAERYAVTLDFDFE